MWVDFCPGQVLIVGKRAEEVEETEKQVIEHLGSNNLKPEKSKEGHYGLPKKFDFHFRFYIMVRVGDYCPQNIQHCRTINDSLSAILIFTLFYTVKIAKNGAKIFKINKMAKKTTSEM